MAIAAALHIGAPAELPPRTVDDPAALFVSPTSIPTLDEPRWIVHALGPRESLSAVAARYGVTIAQLREWNRIEDDDDLKRRRRGLRVLARRIPPAPLRIAYVVQPGEGWDDIAARMHLRWRALAAAHPKLKVPKVGDTIVAWIDPTNAPAFETGLDAIEWTTTFDGTARSVGTPQRGRLEHGIALPTSPLWELAHPTRAFGSHHTITTLTTAFRHLRNEVGYRGTVVIGAISRPNGGRFRPHLSHQSGRDIDIRLPLRPGREDVRHATADDIDWYATWAIVDAFVRTGETEAIFLEMGRQERLYTAARAMGVERERLTEIIRWPNWSGPQKPLVRHSDGHDTHIHVRIRCGDDEPRCKSDGRD